MGTLEDVMVVDRDPPPALDSGPTAEPTDLGSKVSKGFNKPIHSDLLKNSFRAFSYLHGRLHRPSSERKFQKGLSSDTCKISLTEQPAAEAA